MYGGARIRSLSFFLLYDQSIALFSSLPGPISGESGDEQWPLINLELAEKWIFEKRPNWPYGDHDWMCPKDGYIVFRNSEVRCLW